MATSLNQHFRKCMLEPRKLQLIQARTHKFRTKNPRPKPMRRRVFEEITKPIYPEKPRPYLYRSCLDPNMHVEEEPNPYEEFLVKQLEKKVLSSELLIICQVLPISRLKIAELRKDYFPDDIKIEILNNGQLKRVIKDTKLVNLEPLLIERNVLISCQEPKVVEMLAPLKRYPEVIPLGGYVVGKLVTQPELKNIAKLPPLNEALSQLAYTLKLAAGARTHALLNSHQQKLSSNLEEYRKQLGEKEK